MSERATLARRLGLGDAVVIGLGSMIGAGVFAVFAPAARAAGTWLLVGLAVAAAVAYCNATASAQLAAAYPRAGGTYLYGREVLGEWWGFLAGWGFVVGKTASCAAMAMTFAAYAVPDGWQRPVAAAVVVVLALVNCAGITRTAGLTRVIVALVLVALAVAVAAALGGADAHGLGEWDSPDDAYGVLQSAGLLFFAFAGYARIATLGEEVRDPERVIPRAIVAALLGAVAVYGVVGYAVLHSLGADATAGSTQPLADAVAAGGWDWAAPVVRVGAALAAAGALLALVAGLGRTSLAMAREGDLPRWLDAVHPRFHVPHRAELTVAAVVVVLVLLVDLRGVIGFSSFGVLLYYFVANAAARAQGDEVRRYPRRLQLVGGAGCAVLVVTLPWESVVAGVAVFAVGVGYRWMRRAVTARRENPVTTIHRMGLPVRVGAPYRRGMLPPEEAVDRLAAVMKAPPGHRILHAKGQFYSGTFNASPDATAICRAHHLQGDTIPVLVRWSHGSGRPDSNDEAPYVRGMSVSFVLPDGTSTDLLGQTVPRFPVRTPQDFVRLTEVARDRRALVRFLATRPRTALALAANARVKALAPPKSYAEATYFPIHAYRWLTKAGGGTWVRYRLVPQATPRERPAGRFKGRDRLREEMRARLEQGPVRFDLAVTVAGPKDNPHDPMSVWKGSRDFVAGWLEISGAEDNHEAQGDVVVFDPTRVVDGIELSDDPILHYRPSAYAVSIERRSKRP